MPIGLFSVCSIEKLQSRAWFSFEYGLQNTAEMFAENIQQSRILVITPGDG